MTDIQKQWVFSWINRALPSKQYSDQLKNEILKPLKYQSMFAFFLVHNHLFCQIPLP